ncbi:hypothetical protein GNI_162600 [Gregarina niphandrodes]|uniref:Uncharacterized protein n=1 Tax=Gregarina niphandrodes TaxID=110365 RepID=A0A023AZD8_GRENI|nr:hypothetical protein GNI_162600 [Gregarina niphandrodes]EZG43675.1 hypothetical protein GNI_162600 [Gregarina niphandrodes]|eukprot:XP_011133082.1 hypothetical protein GNI_162600 [Gregarina niphandrodes]
MAKKRKPSSLRQQQTLQQRIWQQTLQLQSLQQQTEHLKGCVTQRNTELAQRNKALREKNAKLEELNRSIADRQVQKKACESKPDTTAMEMDRKLAAYRQRVADRKLAAVNEEVEAEAGKLRDMKHLVENEQAKRDTLQTQKAALEHDVQILDTQVSQLHAELHRAEQLRVEQLRVEQLRVEQLRVEQLREEEQSRKTIIIPARRSRLEEIREQKKVLKHLRLCVEQCREELAGQRHLSRHPTVDSLPSDHPAVGSLPSANNNLSDNSLSNCNLSGSSLSGSSLTDMQTAASRGWCFRLPSFRDSQSPKEPRNSTSQTLMMGPRKLMEFVKRPWRSLALTEEPGEK